MSGPFLHRTGAGVLLAGPAVGLIESASLARGLVIADAMVKRAAVTLALARPVTPGKYVTIVTGDVGEVDEAMNAGAAAAGHTLVDRLYLPQAHETLLGALGHGCRPKAIDAIGIIETVTVAATLLGADLACKAAAVELVELRLADGLGGKAYFVVSAELDLVDAAVYAVEHGVEPGLLLGRERIARPHDDILALLAAGSM